MTAGMPWRTPMWVFWKVGGMGKRSDDSQPLHKFGSSLMLCIICM
jgi:hypothetical protein